MLQTLLYKRVGACRSKLQNFRRIILIMSENFALLFLFLHEKLHHFNKTELFYVWYRSFVIRDYIENKKIDVPCWALASIVNNDECLLRSLNILVTRSRRHISLHLNYSWWHIVPVSTNKYFLREQQYNMTGVKKVLDPVCCLINVKLRIETVLRFHP